MNDSSPITALPHSSLLSNRRKSNKPVISGTGKIPVFESNFSLSDEILELESRGTLTPLLDGGIRGYQRVN